MTMKQIYKAREKTSLLRIGPRAWKEGLERLLVEVGK